MTQEDKELLLKDLCARLLYGVKIQLNKEFIVELLNIEQYDFLKWAVNGFSLEVDDVKPYLRPMSSMTEEEYNKYELTFDNLVVYSGHNNNNIHSEHRPTYETFDYLDSIHVDYRGLIEKGLAIAVTEENNPYK